MTQTSEAIAGRLLNAWAHWMQSYNAFEAMKVFVGCRNQYPLSGFPEFFAAVERQTSTLLYIHLGSLFDRQGSTHSVPALVRFLEQMKPVESKSQEEMLDRLGETDLLSISTARGRFLEFAKRFDSPPNNEALTRLKDARDKMIAHADRKRVDSQVTAAEVERLLADVRALLELAAVTYLDAPETAKVGLKRPSTKGLTELPDILSRLSLST